jgi:hypothetical protein
VHTVSDRFAALGLGYYLSGAVVLDHRVAHATVFVSRVDDVAFVEAGGDRRRVLALRRLDALNVTRPVLGMQGEELGDPVVLLDQIETFVANKVAPVAAGEAYPLGDASWRSTGPGARLAAVAGDAIRRELAGHLDPAHDLDPQLIALVIATVRRHEAEHGIDADRDPPLRAAPALARLGVDSGAPSDRFALRARSELSGYVSQIANDPVVPQLALWNFASQAFHADRWGTAEAYAAVVAIEGLARYAGVTAPAPLVTAGRLDRGRLAQLALVLADLPDPALRSAARALWQDQFETRFEPIVDRDARLTP